MTSNDWLPGVHAAPNLQTHPDRYELENEAALDARLDKERRFDPDIWVVEIEPGQAAVEDLVSIVGP